MNLNPEDKIQAKIRKMAFDRRDFLRQQKQSSLQTRHTLRALQEVTGLSHAELEKIAAEVRSAQEAIADDFFSVRDQLFLVLGFVGSLLFLSGVTINWIF